MVAARQRPVLTEDHLDVVELAVVGKRRARHRGARAAAGRLGEAEIDHLVLREAAVEHDVVQAALAGRHDLRHALQRRGQLAVRRHDPHAAGPLGHQHAAVRQEGQRPRMRQPSDHGLDLEIAGRGFECLRVGDRRQASRPARWREAFAFQAPVRAQCDALRANGGHEQILVMKVRSGRTVQRVAGVGPLPHQQHEQDRDVGDVEGDAGGEGRGVVAIDVVEIAREPAAGRPCRCR